MHPHGPLTFSRISSARLHSGSASLYLPRLPYSTARLLRVAATCGEWGAWSPGREEQGGGPIFRPLTHGWVVLAQGLLPNGQGIVEQVGSFLVLVLVPGWGKRVEVKGCEERKGLRRGLPGLCSSVLIRWVLNVLGQLMVGCKPDFPT